MKLINKEPNSGIKYNKYGILIKNSVNMIALNDIIYNKYSTQHI